RTFVLKCKDSRLAETVTDLLAAFPTVDGSGPVVRGGNEHLPSVFGGEQIDSTGNRLCCDRAWRHLRWFGLQHAEKLPLKNPRVRPTVTMCGKNFDLQVF